MTQDNRVVIDKGLDASKPLSTIAAELGKDPTTISKEIKKHRVFQEHNKFNEPAFRCALAKDCHKKHVCSTELFCKKECKRCNKCVTALTFTLVLPNILFVLIYGRSKEFNSAYNWINEKIRNKEKCE